MRVRSMSLILGADAGRRVADALVAEVAGVFLEKRDRGDELFNPVQEYPNLLAQKRTLPMSALGHDRPGKKEFAASSTLQCHTGESCRPEVQSNHPT